MYILIMRYGQTDGFVRVDELSFAHGLYVKTNVAEFFNSKKRMLNFYSMSTDRGSISR